VAGIGAALLAVCLGLHPRELTLAGLRPGQQLRVLVRSRGCSHDVKRSLQHLGPLPAPRLVGRAGEERRSFRQVPEDRVRFGQAAPVVELQHGDAAVRVLRAQKLGGPRRAAVDVVLDAIELATELGQQQADLVGVRDEALS